jgi:hypothetical protein
MDRKLATIVLLLLPAAAGIAQTYDAGLGTLPDAQGFTYSGDGANPSPFVANGALQENATAGGQYWSRQDSSVDLSKRFVLEATLHIISSNYVPNVGTGTREGYYLHVYDASLGSFSLGLAESGFNVNTIGSPNHPLTPYPIPVTDGFHIFRIEVTNSVASILIDGIEIASGIPADPLTFENNIAFGASAGASRSVTELKYLTYGSLCSISLNPTSATFPLTGGAGSFAIDTPEGCPWTATTQADWVSDITPASGTGPSTVSFAVAQNASQENRSGTIQVNDHTFTVNQTACVVPGLAPITNTYAQMFEDAAPASPQWSLRSPYVDIALDLAMKDLQSDIYSLFLVRVARQSAFRPLAYQAHFYDVANKKKALLNAIAQDPTQVQACALLSSTLDAEIGKHRLKVSQQGVPLVSKPQNSKHSTQPANAIDLDLSGLNIIQLIQLDTLAAIRGLARPCFSSTTGNFDSPHFALIGTDCSE